MQPSSSSTDIASNELAADLSEATAIASAAARGWSVETEGYLARLAEDSAAAWRNMAACKTPLEVMAVQQAWIVARSEALAEASLRLWGVAAGSAAAAAAEPNVFHLPD